MYQSTIVTAFYKIPSKASFEKYLTWIKNFLTFIESPIIFFTSGDLVDIFKSIKKQDLHCIVESRKKDQEIFSIGEILEVNKKSVVIRNYNPVGKFDKKPRKINFKNMELINFNDNYSLVFRKYLEINFCASFGNSFFEIIVSCAFAAKPVIIIKAVMILVIRFFIFN
jgi:hypothetical protein